MTDKATAGRRARNRGRDFERSVAKYFDGELVPLSGALGGQWSGDVKIEGWQVQCKRTKALTTQRKWLEHDNSDILIQANPGEHVNNALVVMKASTFLSLLNQKNGEDNNGGLQIGAQLGAQGNQ